MELHLNFDSASKSPLAARPSMTLLGHIGLLVDAQGGLVVACPPQQVSQLLTGRQLVLNRRIGMLEHIEEVEDPRASALAAGTAVQVLVTSVLLSSNIIPRD